MTDQFCLLTGTGKNMFVHHPLQIKRIIQKSTTRNPCAMPIRKNTFTEENKKEVLTICSQNVNGKCSEKKCLPSTVYGMHIVGFD